MEPFHHPLGLLGLDGVLCLFNQCYDVAHPKDTAGDALGLKGLKRVHLFAQADKLDRCAGDRAHRQRRPPASVAIHPRQDNASDANFIVKLSRDIDCVLTGQPVDHQQRFARVGDIAHGGGLCDQIGVDMQPAGGI